MKNKTVKVFMVQPSLYIIRHGQTDWNAQRRVQGLQDIPLNAIGRQQACDSGECLRWLISDFSNIDFVTSPLQRAQETMAIVCETIGVRPSFRCDDRLKEIDFGRWEGLTWEEIRKTDPDNHRAREADPAGYVMPDGESYAMLAARVRPLLESLVHDTVIVAHGGISRVILSLLAGVDDTITPKLDIPQDRILMVRPGRFAWIQTSSDLEVR